MYQSKKYRNITVSGKIATGTTTLAKNLEKMLDWKHINAGAIQRHYDREHGINENAQGADSRSDEHEKQMEASAKKILNQEKQIIYEAWLSGFVAREIPGVLRILLICSDDAVRVDRVSNREEVTIDQAKKDIKNRENENITKWKKIYGDYDFWDPKYFDLIIDTFSSGPMETLGKALDKLGFTHDSKI
jgi:cytidylate kinase